MQVSNARASIFQPLEIPSLGSVFGKIWLEDIAMDLGTANTLVYLKGKGIVLNEPSVVAVDDKSGEVIAAGGAAKEMYGKTSRAVRCIRPMKDGVIADFEMTKLMIGHMLSQVCHRWALRRPRIAIGIPSGITQVEKRAVIDAALSCGAKKVFLIEEPMAAALGSGLPISRPCGNMIVDIGGGTTEVAIISMRATSYCRSIRVAGDEMDEAIVKHLRRLYGVEIGVFEAERIKMIAGSAIANENRRDIRAYGRDLESSIPRQLDISDDIIRAALHEPIDAIVTAITEAVEQISPELAQDVMSRGIFLAGGGSLLRGLPDRLARETGLSFYRTQDPLSAVVRGVGQVIEDLKSHQALCVA